MEMGSPERVRAERDLISRSVMVEIDADGRIVLPPRVREKMGFAGDLAGDAEAAFAGFTNRFRLYRREVYDAELAEDEDDDIDPLTLVGRHKRTG
jgi:MraZ protein